MPRPDVQPREEQPQDPEPPPVDVPVIDVTTLVSWSGAAVPDAVSQVADEIDRACQEFGFFTVVGHGIDPCLFWGLESLARQFFALPEDEKARIAMVQGGRAWRGWFPVGGELTSGAPDHKEGLYFGEEIAADDPRVAAGLPLHGPNLFPERPAPLRDRVLEAIDALSALGQRLVSAIGIALGLGPEHFAEHVTADPVVLMRIFHYPPARGDDEWGVGEHTDYGLLTLLHQDPTGGLEVRIGESWTAVEHVQDSLVCNLGDMLERMTAGRYRATTHRVRTPTADRISIPFFFDPSWDADVAELALAHQPTVASADRWDGQSLDEVTGSYGDYLTTKVAKVFPALFDATHQPGTEGCGVPDR